MFEIFEQQENGRYKHLTRVSSIEEAKETVDFTGPKYILALYDGKFLHKVGMGPGPEGSKPQS